MSLDVLGLGEAEQTAYRALVEMSSSSIDELAAAIDRDQATTAWSLSVLEQVGLVARSGADEEQFVASPPEIALGALLLQHQENIHRAEAEMMVLGQAYRGAASGRTEDIVDVVRGPDAVRQRFNQLQRGANREVLEFVKGSVVAVSREDNVEEGDAIDRGVGYRFVLERGTLERGGVVEAAGEAIRRGVKVRVTRALPTRLLVVDRELAMIPLAASEGDHTGGALMLHAGGLLDMAVSLFERTWRDAIPLDPSGTPGGPSDDPLEELERQVLVLLNAGLTDRTIATRLDVSVRTIQRRVRDLMAFAEADTRLQLGVQAVRRGWL